MILLAWQGLGLMFSHEGLADALFDFAKLLLFLAFGYAIITFYEAPLPGIGVSFSNLITDQTHYFQSVLDARSFDQIFAHVDELWSRVVQPDAWALLQTLLYVLLLTLVVAAKAVMLTVVSFGLIASGVCALVGPIFVPFFIVPMLDFLFWGWLKSFLQYSFVPVIAIAYLMIAEQFIFRFLTTLPASILPIEYGLYGLQAIAVLLTFLFGMSQVPSLTSSIFNGVTGQTALSAVSGARLLAARGALRR